MKIKTSPTLELPMTNSLWPKNKTDVLDIANLWYKPELISINYDAINNLPLGTIIPPHQTNLTIQISDNPRSLINSIKYSIALNSINYMFWSLDQDAKFQRYEEAGKVGANLMTDLFSKAWNDLNSPLNQALNGKALTDQDIQNMFGNIPSISSRTQILNEVLTNPLLEKLSNDIANDATNLVKFTTTHASRLAELFPQAYGDEVLKKSQLAISAVWRNSIEHGFQNDCDLTAFADYQVPNVLRALGIIDYEKTLADKIDSYQLIEEHSNEEKALRGASILAVELLAKQQGVNVADVDYWLWSKRKEPKTPFHLTDTTAY